MYGVREDYIRAFKSESNETDTKARGKGSKSKQASLPRLIEGMRLHAMVSGKTGKFLPGRVLKYNQHGTVDVECEGVVKHGLTAAEIIVGLTPGLEVVCRKPVVVNLNCTGVNFNCNGSMVAAAFGRDIVNGWCEYPGAICVWRIFNTMDPSTPNFILDHTMSLMWCLFHPINPSITGGSFNGEVIVWDLNYPETQKKKHLALALASNMSHPCV